jgi:ACS family sodium-dependent inorganic phosphate cotransporter
MICCVLLLLASFPGTIYTFTLVKTKPSTTRLVLPLSPSATPIRGFTSKSIDARISSKTVTRCVGVTTTETATDIVKADPVNSSTFIPPIKQQGYAILVLLFLVTALCALDRVAMSVAILPMGAEFEYTESTKGLISSVFSIGYMVGLIPSGLLGTFSSPKNTLSWGVLLWSLAQMATPFAAYTSVPILLCSRFFMGVAEAVAIPTVQTFIARWVPDAQRSLVLGLVLSGLQVGNVAAYVASPMVLDNFNWNGLFLIYGATGFLWLLLWVPIAKDNPTSGEECVAEGCSVEQMEESRMMQSLAIGTDSIHAMFSGMKEKMDSVPWGEICASKEIRAIAVAHAVQNFGLYINLAWLPNYFHTKFDLSVGDSALSAVLPWIGGAVVGSASGYIADKLLQKGVDKTLIRKCAQTFANVVPGIALIGLSVANDLTSDQAVTFFVASVSSAAACVAGFGSSVQDVCRNPKLASTLYSITSVPAVLFGSMGVYLTGVVLDATDQSWDLVFRGTAAVYFLGAAYYASQYEAKKLF